MSEMEKVSGPPCPACACPGSTVVSAGTRWGQATTRRRCDNCGRVWTDVAPRTQQAPPLTRRQGINPRL